MTWIMAWSVFMAYGGYTYGGGFGAAIISFVFWFALLMAARVLILNATKKNQPQVDREQPPSTP